MINKNILQQRVTDKFRTLALHSIVNECFIGGLSLNPSEITDDDKRMLTKYSHSALEQLGGFQLLENALNTNSKLIPNQRVFLADMADICTEAATAAGKRICKESNCSDSKASMNDIVDTATMTDAEYSAFVKKADTMNISEVSELIKKKTLDVLKSEKEQMEADEELDNELKEAIDKTDGMDGATTESYLDMFLDKGSPRHPLTLFSRLNDVAMEVASITPVADIDHIAPVLYRTTFEAFLPELKSTSFTMVGAQESMQQISVEEMCPVNDIDRPKVSLLVSTVVYTLMETLKTLHLYCPAKDTIKQFVLTRTTGNALSEATLKDLMDQSNEFYNESLTVDYSKRATRALIDLTNRVREVSTQLQKRLEIETVTSEINLQVSDMIAKLDHITAHISELLAIRSKRQTPAQESYYEQRNRSQLIADFNRVNTICGKNPNVSEIHLKINPDVPSCIAVEGLNAMHAVCKESYIAVEASIDQEGYGEYLRSVYQESKLSSCGKPVYLVEADGRGKKVAL